MGRYDILLGQDKAKPQEETTAPHSAPTVISPTPAIQQLPERPNGRATERANGKRIITRNSFEVYEDQMDSLRDRSYQEKRAGKIGSMSAMVREAIDSYLKKTS
jgi:hypothetical protein